MSGEGVLAPRRRHLAGGLLLLTFAALGWAALQSSRAAFTNFVMPADPGPFALPALCLITVGAAGSGLLIAGLRSPADPPVTGAPVRSLVPLLFLGSVIAMPSLMPLLGSAPAVTVFAFGWILALGAGPMHRRLMLAAAIALLTGLGVHVVFVRLLNLPLPG